MAYLIMQSNYIQLKKFGNVTVGRDQVYTGLYTGK